MNEFAAALAAGGGGVPFTIQLRADLVSPRMAAGAARRRLPRSVDRRRKRQPEDPRCHEQGNTRERDSRRPNACWAPKASASDFFLQLGYLGEELDDILATRELVDDARPDDIGVSVAYPLPGTKFYELVKSQLGNKRNWQESNDLEMMFSGTYHIGVLPHRAQPIARSGDADRAVAEFAAAVGRSRDTGGAISPRGAAPPTRSLHVRRASSEGAVPDG